MLACRVVCYPHQSHHCIRLYILHGSNCYIGVCILYQSDCQLGYISCTNHITAFGYHAPITAFGYCFLVNDAMESGGCAQKMTLTRNFGLIWWVLWLWPMQEPHRMRSRFIWISKVCVYFHCIILKLKHVFSTPFLTMHMPNNLHFITHCENNIQSPIRNYPIVALHEH